MTPFKRSAFAKSLFALGLGFCASQSALAQTSILKQGIDFAPALNVGARYDTNLSQAADNQPQDESWIAIIEPSLTFGLSGSKVAVNGTYSIYHEAYEYDSEDDHTDHHFNVDIELQLNRRNGLGLNANYHDTQAIRTSVNRADPNEQQGDQSNTTGFSGFYRLGSDTARAQLELKAGQDQMRFDNNLDTASDNQTKERDTDTYTGSLYVRVAPRTKALLEVRQRNFEYLSDLSLLDNESTNLFVGVIWEATAASTGSIRFGNEKKEFDDPTAEDTDLPAWEANISWQPTQLSTFNLMASRGAAEGSVRSDSIDTKNTTASWNHSWTHAIATDLSYNVMEETYKGRTFDGREDETTSYAAKLIYKVGKRGSAITIGYTYKSRDSNSPVEEFEREIADIGFTLQL